MDISQYKRRQLVVALEKPEFLDQVFPRIDITLRGQYIGHVESMTLRQLIEAVERGYSYATCYWEPIGTNLVID